MSDAILIWIGGFIVGALSPAGRWVNDRVDQAGRALRDWLIRRLEGQEP